MMGGREIDIRQSHNGNPPADSSVDSAKGALQGATTNLHTINISQKNNWASGPAGTNLNIKKKDYDCTVEKPISQLKLLGGASSSWRSTAYSRGPVNYPNNGWYNGKKQFDQFTKTGQYIKNTDLPYAVAPISTGVMEDPNKIKGTIGHWGEQFAKYGGAKKKTHNKKKTNKKKSKTKKKKLGKGK